MKKIILIMGLCFGYLTTYTQTFSKTYNLASNHEILDNSQSILRGMRFHDGNIYLHIEHLCDPDTSDNRRAYCTGIYKMNENGIENRSLVLDSLFAFGFNKMMLVDEKMIVVGQNHSEHGGLSNELHVLNLDLMPELKFQYNSNNEQTIENNGFILLNEDLYIYGKNGNGVGVSLSHIQKINSNFELVDEFRFSKGLSFNDCLDLQPTADGNLIYINDWSDGVGATGQSGSEIVKIDLFGNVLDSVVFNDDDVSINIGRTLLASSTGNVYFFSEESPEGLVLPSHGRINKYNQELDSMLWSTELPFNNFSNARRYKALNMIETQNGDILVCGTVFDEGPDGPIANGYDHTWNGFITRLDTDGNILWLRLYKTDNNYPLVPKSAYGRFLNSTIWNIHELEDGRIVTGGTSYHTGWQNDIIRPAGETEFYVWLMTINADGCLDGEECDEVIILDGEYRQKDGYLPIITSEQTWIGQGGGITAPAKSFQYTYSDDSLLIDTNLYFERIQSNEEDGSESYVQGYYRELEGKVYQKFEGNFNEEVIFDITLMEGDTFPILDEIADNYLVVTKVDTVRYKDNVPRKRIEFQCAENSDFFGSYFWIEGIGELFSGTFCILDGIDSQIRCVLSDAAFRIYSTVDDNENCWLTTSTYDLDERQFFVVPNPTNDEFIIRTDKNIVKIEIYDVTGSLRRIVNNSKSGNLSYLQSGIYHLIIYTGEGVAAKRVLKI